MKKIIVHNPCNEYTKKYRYYNIFFDNLIDKLKEKFDIIENRNFANAHKERMPVRLLCGESTLVLECEMIIEDYDTSNIYVLSASDYYSDANLGLFHNQNTKSLLKKILLSQFNRNNLNKHCYNDLLINTIYSSWIYFPFNLYDFYYFYKKRESIQLIDKFYFRGSGLEHRPIIKYFNKDLFHGGNPIGNFDTYANEAINYKIGFSCAGSAQFCYRDIEYMAMGIPMLRFQYTNEMNPPLIPNHHYIAVQPPKEKEEEHILTEEDAKLIEQRFLEVKEDRDLLSFVSDNALSHYRMYIDNFAGVAHTMDLLNIK